MTRTARRGVINLNDIIAYSVLIILCVVVFLLYILTLHQLDQRMVEQGTASAFLAPHGDTLLAVYLASPTSKDADTPTFADELRRCVGEDCPYVQATKDFFTAYCRAYVLQVRSGGDTLKVGPGIKDELNDAVYEDWFLTSDRSSFIVAPFTREKLKDPRASLLVGEQSIPGDEPDHPLQLTLLCIERDGVVTS